MNGLNHLSLYLAFLFPQKSRVGASIATTLVVWRVPQINRKTLVWVSRVVGTGVVHDVFEIYQLYGDFIKENGKIAQKCKLFSFSPLKPNIWNNWHILSYRKWCEKYDGAIIFSQNCKFLSYDVIMTSFLTIFGIFSLKMIFCIISHPVKRTINSKTIL